MYEVKWSAYKTIVVKVQTLFFNEVALFVTCVFFCLEDQVTHRHNKICVLFVWFTLISLQMGRIDDKNHSSPWKLSIYWVHTNFVCLVYWLKFISCGFTQRNFTNIWQPLLINSNSTAVTWQYFIHIYEDICIITSDKIKLNKAPWSHLQNKINIPKLCQKVEWFRTNPLIE